MNEEKKENDLYENEKENITEERAEGSVKEAKEKSAGAESEEADFEFYDIDDTGAHPKRENYPGKENVREEKTVSEEESVPDEIERKEQGTGRSRKQYKSPKRTVKSVVSFCAAALIFGAVAGVTMFGVNRAAESMFSTEDLYVEEQRLVSETVTTGSVSTVTTDVSDVVEQAMPSVVAITNTMLLQANTGFGGLFGMFGGGQTYEYEIGSSGSGIIVGENDSELLIVTNNHVVEDANELTVTFIDGTNVEAVLKGTDEETDIAVIAISLEDIPAETRSKITIARLGDSDALKLGQNVIAIGNALGHGQSVTVGCVSALGREITVEGVTKEVIQTDAAINPGNSGGALLNMDGEVIGINEAKYSGTDVEGVGYAIPVSDVKEVINALMNKTTRTVVDEDKQGYMGVRLSTVDSSASSLYNMPEGAYIYQILEDGPAADSDLCEGDIVVSLDGDRIKDAASLTEAITYYKAGETVALTVKRLENGEYVEYEIEIRLGKRPAESS